MAEGGGLLTANMKELRQRWMQFYLGTNMVQSHAPAVQKLLDDFKMEMAMFNEKAMEFFDHFIAE